MLADKVRKTGKQNYLEVFPVADASPFAAYAQQAGARWFKVDGDEWVVDMTDDATMKVADFFDGCIDAGLVDTSAGAYSPGWYAACASGRIAAVTSASWGDALIESIQGGKGKWKVAPMQKWGRVRLRLERDRRLERSGARQREAPEGSTRVHHVDDHLRRGHRRDDQVLRHRVVPRQGLLGAQRQKPSAWFSGQNYNEDVFVPAAKEQNVDWSWSPVTQSAFTSLQNQFRRKLTGGLKLTDAVELAQREIVQSFRDKGLSVRTAR